MMHERWNSQICIIKCSYDLRNIWDIFLPFRFSSQSTILFDKLSNDSKKWEYKRKTMTSISCRKVLLKLRCHQIFRTILCLRKDEISLTDGKEPNGKVSIAICFYLFINIRRREPYKRSIKVQMFVLGLFNIKTYHHKFPKNKRRKQMRSVNGYESFVKPITYGRTPRGKVH